MSTRSSVSLFVAVVLLVGVLGCSAAPLQKQHGNEYFTQIGLWAQNGRHDTTNYRSGRYIPVNTRVLLVSSSAETIQFRVPSMGDYTVTMVNRPQYSGENIQGIFNRTFGEEKVDLDRFDEETYRAIRSGEINEGMSKQAVILARGYPPAHHTSSLDANTWKYWNTRFGTILVHFKSGKVTNIEK